MALLDRMHDRTLDRPVGPHRRATRTWVRLALGALVAVLAAAAAWGVAADRTSPASTGEAAEWAGGTLSVTTSWVVDDPMAMMHAGSTNQFAQSGMQMSSMLPDAVPEGSKRVAVQLELVAGDEAMRFEESAARLVADGASYEPYTALLADGLVEPGMRLTGVLTFEIPVEASAATFRLAPDAPVVAVDVSGGESHADHSGHAE